MQTYSSLQQVGQGAVPKSSVLIFQLNPGGWGPCSPVTVTTYCVLHPLQLPPLGDLNHRQLTEAEKQVTTPAQPRGALEEHGGGNGGIRRSQQAGVKGQWGQGQSQLFWTQLPFLAQRT